MVSEHVAGSLKYLNSEAALASLDQDIYWPKWDSPWWHMLLLHEMGETHSIPAAAAEALATHLTNSPSTEFTSGEDCHCHCALGNIYQMLMARGVDVDGRMPWMRDWFLRYQMADGGLNCDPDAYHVEGECPSSMVATISPFESVLLYTDRPWTAEEIQFLDRAAEFLQRRELWQGSPTVQNAEEREQAKAWLNLSFPRFYLYDVLRGLHALLVWADKRQVRLERKKFAKVLDHLGRGVGIGRQAYAGVGTRVPLGEGKFQREQESVFPLLHAVSQNGPSPHLENQWRKCQELAALWLR